jgi:hypothetical protein
MNVTSIRNRISSVPYFEHDRWSGGANGELATVVVIVDADEGIVGSNPMGGRVRDSADFFWYVQRNEFPKMVEHARRAVSGATKCATSRSAATSAATSPSSLPPATPSGRGRVSGSIPPRPGHEARLCPWRGPSRLRSRPPGAASGEPRPRRTRTRTSRDSGPDRREPGSVHILRRPRDY